VTSTASRLPGSATTTLPAAVLFDMDGLLIDTEPIWFDVETQLLAECGATWSPADHAELVGTSSAFASAFLSQRLGGSLSPQEVADTILVRMAERLSRTPRLQPGARRLVEELDGAGVPRALVSSSARMLVDAVLEGLAPLTFEVVVTGDDVAHAKPHPEPYLAAARLLDVHPAACVVLEDSPTGVASASAAGAMVVAVPSVTGIAAAERRVVVPSLEGVDLAYLRRLFTAG
jgi:HAD superfamily hydrolase (TIGR01509 family)